jgi:hypothetical protein
MVACRYSGTSMFGGTIIIVPLTLMFLTKIFTTLFVSGDI